MKAPYDRSKVNAVCRVKLGAMDETHDLLGEDVYKRQVKLVVRSTPSIVPKTVPASMSIR